MILLIEINFCYLSGSIFFLESKALLLIWIILQFQCSCHYYNFFIFT